MFLLNKTKGNTIFYTHLFIKKIMYGHFTFFFLIIISKAQARSKNWWEKEKKKNKIKEL